MANIEKLIEEIDKLTVVELSELVKAIEEKYGVSAAAVAAPAAGGAAVAEEAKSEFDVELKEVGPNKIAIIKVVREITALGLAEAKGLVDAAPKVIKEAVAKAEADEIVAKIAEAGGVAELK